MRVDHSALEKHSGAREKTHGWFVRSRSLSTHVDFDRPLPNLGRSHPGTPDLDQRTTHGRTEDDRYDGSRDDCSAKPWVDSRPVEYDDRPDGEPEREWPRDHHG